VLDESDIVFRIQLVAVIYTNMRLLLEYVVYVKHEVIGLYVLFSITFMRFCNLFIAIYANMWLLLDNAV
jgi:hypothetical protein